MTARAHGNGRVEPAVVDERGAATYTGMSVGYLRQARKRGGGPAHLRLGRAVRYRLHDLNAWLDAHRHEGRTP